MSTKQKHAVSHKALQLSKQAERALQAYFYEEEDFPYLVLDSVEPEPGTSNLIVNCRLNVDPAPELPVGAILKELRNGEGRMRAIIAASISRKRTPGLRFRVLP